VPAGFSVLVLEVLENPSVSGIIGKIPESRSSIVLQTSRAAHVQSRNTKPSSAPLPVFIYIGNPWHVSCFLECGFSKKNGLREVSINKKINDINLLKVIQ
jgi:hypothetical protein